jgi:UDPglucose 6-dehydrogenase
MRVAIFGTGYVGLVTGTCLAEVGHEVACVDIDQAKVDGLGQGIIPIYEPGLEPMVKANHAAGRLAFTTEAASAIAHGQVVFIAVGTPPDEDGSADLQYVLAVARSIGRHLAQPAVVVNKSTVPVGTADKVRAAIAGELAARGVEIAFDVVSNPEFLKEGDAVADCMRPDRIVIGADNPDAVAVLRRLYAPFNRNRDRVVEMIANIAERVGADIEQVRQGIGSDPRIGWHFIYPGAGYGGSCFPKDVQALARTAAQHGHQAQLLNAVEAVNDGQKGHLFELIQRHYDRGEDEGVRGKTFAVWGLAFKPNTDDMRAAPSRRLLAQLWEAGATVRVFDPEAMHEARRVFGERADLVFCETAYEALEGADALAVITEWKQFRSPDFARLRQTLGDAVVFDGRNIYEPQEIEAAGLAYYGIGRGRSLHA